jgi:signal transduction histidine kinase
MRVPRSTVRLRLTLLYGGLFLAAGAGLLAITYLLVARRGVTAMYSGAAASAGGPARAPSPARVPADLRALAARVRDGELHQLLVQSGFALAAMAVVAVGLGWFVAGRVLRPLATMTAATLRISENNLHERLAVDGPDDEIRRLAGTIDGLLGRLEGAFRAQRQFVANASHELRTPLTRQRTLIEVAVGDPEATVESLRAAHGRVLAAVAEQERLIEALLTLARGQAALGRREPVDLAAVAAEMVAARRGPADGSGPRVGTALDTAWVSGDRRLVERLVANLVDNAIDHNVPGGDVEVRAAVRDGHAVLAVANSGPLVPPGEVDRLLLPFQRLDGDRARGRTQGAGGGLGLGLSIVHAIATAHDASLTATPRAGGGLSVEVSFPIHREERRS